MGLFLDARGSEEQHKALRMIFSGQAGGFPAWLSGITGHGQTMGMEIAGIEFEVAGDLANWRAEIPGKVSAAAQALTGPTTPKGRRVQTTYPPGSETGGEVATCGRATSNRVDAMGVKWDATGKSSKHLPFDWSGPD
jgi:hypothetical protein